MIDIHCHVLPNIDDGPQSLKESLDMIKQAINEGIDTIVVTPHRNGIYQPTIEEIKKNRDALQSLLQLNKLELTLCLGQEVRIYNDILEDYLCGKLLTVNSASRYLLIEFDSSEIPRYSEILFYDMRCKGIIPIIVHPERNFQIQQNPEILYRFVQNGALSQITASSVTGHFGKKIQKFTSKLLEANLVHFVASDAHDLKYRNFHMKSAMDILRKKYGSDYVKKIELNAKSAILNEDIWIEEPLKITSSKIFRFFQK